MYGQNMCSGFWDKYCTIAYKAQAFAVRILGPRSRLFLEPKNMLAARGELGILIGKADL